MKLIKHCHEVDLSAPGGIAQGALLGLVTDTRLEITHAFPFPSSSTGAAAGADDSVDDEDFQLDVMRKLRMVNVGKNFRRSLINTTMHLIKISFFGRSPTRRLVPVCAFRRLPVASAPRVSLCIPDFHRGVGLPHIWSVLTLVKI